MLGWRYSYVATTNDPTLVVSFKPCQSAQARELVSMCSAGGNDSSQWSALFGHKAEAFFYAKELLYMNSSVYTVCCTVYVVCAV